MDEAPLLTRFEVARVLGLRSLQLSEGAPPFLFVDDERLREDTLYVAALELKSGKLDARVVRGTSTVDVARARLPSCLDILLDTRDGDTRCFTM
jgi:DNA-directed RNA polymerase subunit K/omega